MKTLLKISAIFISLVYCVLQGQTAYAAWSGEIGVSLISQQLREETLHKLRNHGPVFSFEAAVERRSPSNVHQVMFHLPLGVLIDRYDYAAISIQYGVEGNGLWHLEHGLSIGYAGQLNARYRYFPEWDDSHLYWLTDYTLGPAVDYRFAAWPGLSIYAEIGLVSLVSRSPQRRLNKFDNILTLTGFFSVPQQDFQLRHLGDFQVAKVQLSYDLGESAAHRLYFESRLTRMDDELSFVEIWHGLGWRYVF